MWLLDFLPFWVFHLIVLVGIGGILASKVLTFIPLMNIYKAPIQIAGAVLLIIGLYMEGGISNQEKWEARVAEAKLEMAKKEVASADATVKVVTKYVNVDRIVKENGDAIVKEIPKFISKDADAQCVVPNGFVVLHDSASRNEVPDSTRGVDEGASKVKLSGIAETVTQNYTTYHQVSEQLKALQDWVKQQQSIYNK
jgi:hypothetical protein